MNMKGDDVGDQADELDRGQRTVRVVVAAPVLGLLLWFVGVPVLGAIIEDWGVFLIGVTVLVALYAVAVGAAVAWIFRGPTGR